MAHAVSREGKIVVRKSSEPRETSIWELREQLQQQKQFEQWLRNQQDWQWLSQLPVGCVLRRDLKGSYDCGGRYYWPYRQGGRAYYLQMEPRQLQQMPEARFSDEDVAP
jgi:hypothetical protein